MTPTSPDDPYAQWLTLGFLQERNRMMDTIGAARFQWTPDVVAAVQAVNAFRWMARDAGVVLPEFEPYTDEELHAILQRGGVTLPG